MGNPIYPGSANKLQVEMDYVGSEAFPLKFWRVYNSAIFSNPVTAARLGSNWWHNYYRKLIFGPAPSNIIFAGANRPDGRVLAFKKTGPVFVADPDVVERLEQVSGGWKLTNADEEVELYDSNGNLLSITNRAGLSHTLTYYATGSNVGRIEKVTDSFGRTLTFEYDSRFRISAVVDPTGGRYVYHYGDSFNNLTGVTYPDDRTRSYHYEFTAHNHLTGITDENGQPFATFGYDTAFRPTLSEHAGGAGKVTVAYPDGLVASVTMHVSSTLAATRTYTYQNVQGVLLNNSITGPACPSCGPASQTFDSNGNIATRTDWNGNRTNYSYDLTRNLEISRTEGLTSGGSTTPQTRTISTTWHATFRLPTQITEPGRTTTFTHDANGNVLTRTITAGTSSRTWTYTYNANGSVLTMDGPRTDVSDVTTYTYYANNATCPEANAIGCRGQVESITNASGHVTQITEYNVHGQPLSITDPNGLTTPLAYDTRQRLTSRSVGGETTSYTYDNAGQLTRVTLPDGSFLSYTYDAAHRLTQIADNLGNRIAYTLDFTGNRTQEQVFDPLNQLAQTRSRVYNSLNRLTQEIGAAGQTTAYGYDNQGNVTSIDGPLAGTVDVTTNAYDALNRLVRVTDPNAGQVNYGFNALDQLTSVTDPRSLATSYSYDGLNNLNQLVSPDTGTTTNTYDAAGNLLTQTDAKGQVTGYTYDALNRVASIAYQGGATHTYQYDLGGNGKGRLTQITEPNSTTQYAYDPKGRLLTETRIINAVAYVTSYGYDSAGRMTGMTYPSGRQVAYTLDALGRVSQITTTRETTQNVVSSVAYRPFGPTHSYTFGNGQTSTRGFDQDGRVASYTLGSQSFAVGYDFASRISFINDIGNPPNTNTYSYDNLDRLTNVVTPGTPFAYTYDAVGNRLTKTVGSSTDTYAYAPTANRLASITPGAGPLKNYAHDPNGAITADGTNTYAYDTRGRLIQSVSVIGTSDYRVNAVGQRIRKTNSQGDTINHYDAQGRLIAETSASGAVQKEYIYLGDIPVAVTQ